MVLVTYSDSENESESELVTWRGESTQSTSSQCVPITTRPTQLTRPHKRKADDILGPPTDSKNSPPPLPQSLHSLYATNVRTGTSDDPSLHGGRKRQVIHVQGNWPSHVYLEWHPSRDQLRRLDTVVANVQGILHQMQSNDRQTPGDISEPSQVESVQLHSFLRSPLSAQLPLHVSLSAPLVLRTSNKDSFHTALSRAITAARIGSIDVRLSSLDIVPNFERSRHFLVARLDARSCDKLGELLKACNEVCERFELPMLYQSRSHHRGGGEEAVGVEGKSNSHRERGTDADGDGDGDAQAGAVKTRDHLDAFHISIAWTLIGVTDAVREQMQQITLEGVEKDVIRFEQIKVKIGNIVDNVPL